MSFSRGRVNTVPWGPTSDSTEERRNVLLNPMHDLFRQVIVLPRVIVRSQIAAKR
jgi:hypothetical protein